LATHISFLPFARFTQQSTSRSNIIHKGDPKGKKLFTNKEDEKKNNKEKAMKKKVERDDSSVFLIWPFLFH